MYILLYSSHGGNDLLGIFSTAEKARDYAKQHFQENYAQVWTPKAYASGYELAAWSPDTDLIFDYNVKTVPVFDN